MNSFGRIFRITVYGESHGPSLGVVLDGVRPGISLIEGDFEMDIKRRMPGMEGTTTRIERDVPIFKSGVFNQKTTGAPLAIEFENQNFKSSDYNTQMTIPRPGHADFVAEKKFFGYNDYRGGGHFSGRLSLLLVAAGVVAKKMLEDIKITSKIIAIGGEEDPLEGIKNAVQLKDSVGGIIECCVSGLKIGVGEPFFDSVESVLSHLIFSIPAVKGIEFGSGFKAAKMYGSQHNDSILDKTGKTLTNHSGGISGGITNGNDLIVRIAVKPTSSTPQKQVSWNKIADALEEFKIEGRHDLCIALRVPVVLEAVISIGLCDLIAISNYLRQANT